MSNLLGYDLPTDTTFSMTFHALNLLESQIDGNSESVKPTAVVFQEREKPSPPQKPLPADPLGRTSRLGRNHLAMGVHLPGPGPLPIPIPTVPRPPPAIPLPNRWVWTPHDRVLLVHSSHSRSGMGSVAQCMFTLKVSNMRSVAVNPSAITS